MLGVGKYYGKYKIILKRFELLCGVGGVVGFKFK